MNHCRLRNDARRIFQAGLAAAEPGAAVEAALEVDSRGRPLIAEEALPGVLQVVAFGKAAIAMAARVHEVLSSPGPALPGIAIVNAENFRELERTRVYVGGHPLPTSAGADAALKIRYAAHRLDQGDGLLALISGGGSALLAAPADGITLADKVAITRALLASGAPITEVNAVRKHLSALKGGGLAALAHPARIEALILSDVVGDDPATIASGPTAPDPTTFDDALTILREHSLLTKEHAAVRTRLGLGAGGLLTETLKPGDAIFDRVRNRVVAGNRHSLEATRQAAVALGYETRVIERPVEGEARGFGGSLAGWLARPGDPTKALAILAGGETTVTVTGSGTGGRNQELAVAFALGAERASLEAETDGVRPWTLLSGSTDGRDGPTDSAGGLVDDGTLERARSIGLDPEAELEANNSYALLAGSGDLLQTGPTGTNVADLLILLIGAAL